MLDDFLRLHEWSRASPLLFLLNPIRDKDIRLALLCSVPIRSKHQLLSIGRKHRKTVERVVVGNPLYPCTVNVNHIKIKITALRIGNVRRENYPFAVGEEVGREAGFVQVSDLSLV